MKQEGPTLESLTHRLAETPPSFLGEPRLGANGTVHVDAVAHDLIQLLGGTATPADFRAFSADVNRQERNHLSIAMILCWLLSDDWFKGVRPPVAEVLKLLETEAAVLARQLAAGKYVTDPDRREELARLTLARLGYRPAGETISQAQDRLTSLSSAERTRVMAASREAEVRARKIREALVRKAAEASADKWTRE